MLLTTRTRNDVAFPDFLLCPSSALDPSLSVDHQKNLPQGMCMPSCTGAWFKGNAHPPEPAEAIGFARGPQGARSL